MPNLLSKSIPTSAVVRHGHQEVNSVGCLPSNTAKDSTSSFNGARRAVILDPSEPFAVGFRLCLISLGYEAVDAYDVMSVIKDPPCHLRLDVLLVGPHLVEHEAFKVCRAVTAMCPGTAVYLFHMDADDLLVQVDAVSAGVTACLPVCSSCDDLLEVLAATARGHELFLRERIYEASQVPDLTRREQDVLACVADGLSYVDTARVLGIAVSTARNTGQRAIEKLSVHTRSEAVRRGQRRGMI